MTLKEEQKIILNWVEALRAAMGPKKKEKEVKVEEAKEGERPYHLNGYKHKVYD